MSDIVTFGETMIRLSPERGERLEAADSLAFRTAGAESNVAVTASRLGADTMWASKLPDTLLGRRVAADVRRHGVNPSIEWSEDGRQGTYYIEQGGEPRGTNVIYDRSGAAITTAKPSDVPIEAIRSSSIFFTTGITPALSETVYRTIRELLDVDTTTAFDLNYRKKLWSQSTARSAYEELLPDVDLLFVPERDARLVLEIDRPVESIANDLRRRFDCDLVVVTRGEAGALASTSERTVVQSTFDTETLDPIGTGDAFVGAFLSRYVEGGSVSEALQWGAAAAALKRTIEGDLAIISESEVRSVITDGISSIDR